MEMAGSSYPVVVVMAGSGDPIAVVMAGVGDPVVGGLGYLNG